MPGTRLWSHRKSRNPRPAEPPAPISIVCALVVDERDRDLLRCALAALARAWREPPWYDSRRAADVLDRIDVMDARLRDRARLAALRVDEQIDAAIAALPR